MRLSVFSVWGSLLSLVASQGCLDPSENSASWVKLKPLGQCKDGENTCPYRITLPPLTVQLPKPFRELEKMARELQSLTLMVNQLKNDCHICKERQRMDWNIQTGDEGEDGERIQASRGTLNTKDRHQDIAKKESTVQITTSVSAVDETMIISSNAKDVNSTDFEKQRNTNQKKNGNPFTTKPRAENNGRPKGSNFSSQKNTSHTTTKKKILQSPVGKLTESTFPGDPDSEHPINNPKSGKHKTNTIKVGHEMYSSGTLNVKGKVKSIPEYHVVTIVTEDDDNGDDDGDDDVETKLPQTKKSDKVLGGKQLVTDVQNNRELEPNMKQLTRKKQDKEDKKEVAATGLKELRSSISDDTNNGNVDKEGSVSIQQPTLKDKEKKIKNNHNVSSTQPKPLQTGAYSERDAEVNSGRANTREKKLISPITGRANASVSVSQINPQTLEIKSKNTFKTDKKIDIGIQSKFNLSEGEHGRGKDPQTLESKNQVNAGTVSESDGGVIQKVMTVETVSELNNSRSLNSTRPNSTAEAYLLNPKIQKSNFQTSLKPGTDAGSYAGIDSNPVNGLKNSDLSIPDIGDDRIDVSPTNPEILDSSNQFKVGTDSENDAGIDSNPADNTQTVGEQETSSLPISAITDGIVEERDPKGSEKDPNHVKVSIVNRLKNSGSSISHRANSTADIDKKPLQSLNSQSPSTHVRDVKRIRVKENQRVPALTDAVGVNQTYPETLDGTFRNPFKPVTDKERKAELDSNAFNPVETNTPLEMPVNTVTVNQINPQTVNSASENTTLGSSQVNKVEIISQTETPRSSISDRSHAKADQINQQAMDYISKTPLKLGKVSESQTGLYPNQDHMTDIARQQEMSESDISDSRLDVSDTNPSLNNHDLTKIQILPKSKLNVTSGMHLPNELRPISQEKQQESTNQTERTTSTGISLSKDFSHIKPYILKRILVNESKVFGSRAPKNTNGVTDHTITYGTAQADSKTASSPNNELNIRAYDKSQSVMPTTVTQGMVDQTHIKRAKTAPIAEELHTMVNSQIGSTSQTIVTKKRLERPGGNSQQNTVNNIRRDSQPPVMEQTKGQKTDRKTEQTAFKTSSVVSNQERYKKPLRGGSTQNLGVKMPLNGVSSDRNELNYTTTPATPYPIKAEFKDKHSKLPELTPPVITIPHFMDQNHAEQAKTTSGVKVSSKHAHHRLENPSQEIESKRSHSDTGNKTLQNASNGQGSSAMTDFQPNSLDSIQNKETGPIDIVMDKLKVSISTNVSTTSTENTNENRARDSDPVVMLNVETTTEANQVTSSSVNAPIKYHRYSKTPLGYTDSEDGRNPGQSIDNNNGNSYKVPVHRMTGSTLHKIPAGHINNGDNMKALTVSDMDDRQGLKKQLLTNCHGRCDLRPTSQSILNSPESSNTNRDKTSQDCSDFIMRNPTIGIYNVTPNGSDNKTFPVFCDMKSIGGGWTLIQHRFDGSISFNRTWNDYKRGFGNLTGEFWLGNDKIHWLTTAKAMVLRIELEDLDGIKEYALYDHFHVANESQYYRLTIEGYSGTAGDAMQYSKKFNHNQKNFTTPDRDNDQYTSGNCGAYYSSGWWFDACIAANLNGKYYERRYRGVRNGIFWGTWHNISSESYLTHDRQGFKTVKMMIRPRKGLLMD